jgi:glucokinase
MYLAIEIGGTKLQLALGRGDGVISDQHIVRSVVTPEHGGEGIRQQIESALPQLLKQAGVEKQSIKGVGVGFGGPTDDETQSVIKSHHIHGWDNFPLATWLTELTGLRTVICNDADVAGLGEAEYGAGKNLSPIFYMTVGSGIGGGLIINGEIYRGVGKGAAEVGHVRPNISRNGVHSSLSGEILEAYASGWSIGKRGSEALGKKLTGAEVTQAVQAGDKVLANVLDEAVQALAEGICTVIKLLCPRRIVIGGGISLSDPNYFFVPLRKYVAERGFAAFAEITDIVPAELGEAVVLHGAIALAKRKFGKSEQQ